MLAPEEIARRVEQMPVLSAHVGQLGAMVENPRVSALDVEAVLRPDPSLTANVLRMANSVYFRALAPVSSVRDAVVRLGIRKVAELALGNSFRNLMPPELPGFGTSSEQFWRHSAAVAILSDRIGHRIAAKEPYFTAGLLHDMGKLVVAQVDDVAHHVRFTDISVEREVLCTDHGEIGLEVARQWRLPVAIGIAACWHHQPFSAPAPLRLLACAVHIADGLAHSLVSDGIEREVESAACAALDLDDGALAKLCEESYEDLSKLGDVLAMKDSNATRVA